MNKWPMCDCMIEQRFSALHSLPGLGVADQHSHDYIARFGFRHEASPFTGASGSKGLQDWVACIEPALALVANKELNAVLAPRPPTLEMLTLYLLAHIPAYFNYVECESYDPRYIVRIDRAKAPYLGLEWSA